MRRMLLAIGGMAVLWAAAIAVVWVSPWFVGSPFGMGVAGIAWLGVAGLTAILGGLLGGRWWLAVGGVVVTMLLAVPLYNWSAAAPAAYFEVHRPLYERAARTAQTDDSVAFVDLPFALRPLSAMGSVRDQGGMMFFPQWYGFADNAGGYFYAPERSPEGSDMHGQICVDPRDLGDGWWACGMAF
jgi:hypothetical protein